jgi:tetratricopeptide (TPR) repeat protein
LVDEASGKVTGRICHIRARSPDGRRYDPEQSEKERHGFANLVLMCPMHHDVIDNDAETFTVEKLLEMKTRHEARYAGGAEPNDAIARQFLLQFEVQVAGDVVLRDKIVYEAGAAAPSSLHQLPADLPDFTGREDEVRELVAVLGEGAAGATISAIGGMGGVGKTALAVHVAHRVVERYPGGQIVVEMGGTSERPLTPVEAMGQVLHAFQPDMRLPEGPNEVAALYRTILEGRKALLLLDNAANSAQVRPLMVPAGCGLVVTSRHNISLPGLRHLDLDALPEKKARKLLRTIVGRRRATEEELGAIVGLCGRLPLALRVAGDFLVVHPDWSAAEYAQALADERERLARLKHEDLDVGAALGLSAAQLVRERPDLAARWQMLSVFPAPFERAAAAAVWGVEEREARDGLSELAARSLVLYEREGGLYRPHDLMRLVAEDAFGYGGGEREVEGERARLGEAAVRHAAYYLEVGNQANILYLQGGERVVEGLRLFDGAWPHLRAAYGRMRERGERAAVQWTSEFPDRVAYVLNLRLPPRDRIPILEAAAAAREIGERGLEGNHLGTLGLAYAALGEVRRAIGTFEQALAISREIGDRRNEGAHLGNLGSTYFALGEVRRAIEYYEQALKIDREIGDRRGEGNALGALGLAYAALGEVRRAIEYYEQSLAIFREIGDQRGEGNDLGNLGLAYAALGEVRRAIEYHEQALEIAREIGDRGGEGNRLGNLGNAYAALGEVWRALEYYEQALVIAREIGDRHLEGNTLASLGLLAKNQGDLARAHALWQQALEIYEAIEDPNAERVRGWLAGLEEGDTGAGTG